MHEKSGVKNTLDKLYHLELLLSFLYEKLTILKIVKGYVHLLICNLAAVYAQAALFYGPEAFAVARHKAQFLYQVYYALALAFKTGAFHPVSYTHLDVYKRQV